MKTMRKLLGLLPPSFWGGFVGAHTFLMAAMLLTGLVTARTTSITSGAALTPQDRDFLDLFTVAGGEVTSSAKVNFSAGYEVAAGQTITHNDNVKVVDGNGDGYQIDESIGGWWPVNNGTEVVGPGHSLDWDSQNLAFSQVLASFAYGASGEAYYTPGNLGSITLSGDATPSLSGRGFLEVTAESASTDDLDTISTSTRAVYLKAATGETITVKHGVGNIYNCAAGDLTLPQDTFLYFVSDGTDFYQVCSS